MVRSTFERAFQIRGENCIPESAKLSRVSQINRFFVTVWFIPGISVWVLVISLDGWRIGYETYIDVLLVSSALSPPKFTLIGNDVFFYEFSVDKLVFLNVRGYLGERSSRKSKSFREKKTCFWYTFFSIVQFCVRISASNFQFPSPKAISYNKLILKTENGGFSTFAGVFDPGRGRIGPALLKVRLAFCRDASNDVCHFFRRGVWNCKNILQN